MNDHHWSECAPTLFRISPHLDGAWLDVADRVECATQRVWARTTDSDRQAFHRGICLNSGDEADLNVIARLAHAIEDESTPGGGAPGPPVG